MAWSNSKVFRPFLADVLTRTATALDLDADSFKAALYANSITPDNDVTSANSAYGSGVWTATGAQDGTGGQVYHTGHWAQGGQAIGSPSVNSATADTVFFDAADTASTDSATTISNAYGVLVYDDTVTSPADQGISYNYFGGSPQGVTAGTFTIVWNANGIFRFTL